MSERPLCWQCERRADAALLVGALARLAGSEIETARDRRAWELIGDIAAEHGTTPGDLLRDAPQDGKHNSDDGSPSEERTAGESVATLASDRGLRRRQTTAGRPPRRLRRRG